MHDAVCIVISQWHAVQHGFLAVHQEKGSRMSTRCHCSDLSLDARYGAADNAPSGL